MIISEEKILARYGAANVLYCRLIFLFRFFIKKKMKDWVLGVSILAISEGRAELVRAIPSAAIICNFCDKQEQSELAQTLPREAKIKD
jgi:hypothetical protein